MSMTFFRLFLDARRPRNWPFMSGMGDFSAFMYCHLLTRNVGSNVAGVMTFGPLPLLKEHEQNNMEVNKSVGHKSLIGKDVLPVSRLSHMLLSFNIIPHEFLNDEAL